MTARDDWWNSLEVARYNITLSVRWDPKNVAKAQNIEPWQNEDDRPTKAGMLKYAIEEYLDDVSGIVDGCIVEVTVQDLVELPEQDT